MRFDDVPQMSDQEFRIHRSGLKPEPGAWERVISRLDMREHMNTHGPRLQAEISARDAAARCVNDIAKIGMPLWRPGSKNFRPVR